MCSNLKLSRTRNIVNGDVTTYIVHIPDGQGKTGIRLGVWGFNKGIIYNVRMETTNDKWKEYSANRGYIKVIGFAEKKHEFRLKNDDFMYVAVIYNKHNEFAILTEDSQAAVALVHHRMPVILDDNSITRDKWLNEGKILHLDPYLLISNKTA